MVAKLERDASGLSHLRWVKKILANARAHQKHNYLLSPAQQAALAVETSTLDSLYPELKKGGKAIADEDDEEDDTTDEPAATAPPGAPAPATAPSDPSG